MPIKEYQWPIMLIDFRGVRSFIYNDCLMEVV